MRLTERFLKSDPPTADELAAAAQAVRELLPDLRRERRSASPARSPRWPRSSSAAYDPERVHGYRLSREAVEAQLERLASLTVAERRELPGLDPERAPVIVAGAAIAAEVMSATTSPSSRSASATSSTAPRSRPPSCPSRKRAKRRPGAYTCC